MFEAQERLVIFERMKEEYEKLYGEFLIKSISAEKDKMRLERRLYKVNHALAVLSGCNKRCLISWADYKQMTRSRAIIIGGITLALILLIIICSV
jgi:hypothetical protein